MSTSYPTPRQSPQVPVSSLAQPHEQHSDEGNSDETRTTVFEGNTTAKEQETPSANLSNANSGGNQTRPEAEIEDSEEEDSELFSAALNLEDQFYSEGYELGVADGTRAGLSEGRVFGLEKGFEKFAEMGRLAGRAAVWRARVAATSSSSPAEAMKSDGDADSKAKAGESQRVPLPPISDRLMRQLKRLGEATDERTLVMENSEQGVDEFDERLREARGKAAIIARAFGQREEVGVDEGAGVEDTGPKQSGPSKVRIKDTSNKAAGGAGEMEDFAGLPGSKK